MVEKHIIVEVDEPAQTGYCRGCGTRVALRRHTRGGWVCAPNKIAVDTAYKARVPVEHRREVHRQWRVANHDRLRAKHLLKKYGLAIEEYEAMLTAQGGHCAVCNQQPSPEDRGGILHVDHCHATGQVRGLLCASCNLVLGQIGDDPERARQLADYLVRHAALADHPAVSSVVV